MTVTEQMHLALVRFDAQLDAANDAFDRSEDGDVSAAMRYVSTQTSIPTDLSVALAEAIMKLDERLPDR